MPLPFFKQIIHAHGGIGKTYTDNKKFTKNYHCGGPEEKVAIKTVAYKQAIIEYLTDHVLAKSQEFVELLGVKISRVKVILKEMVEEGIIIAEGDNKNRTYRLKK